MASLWKNNEITIKEKTLVERCMDEPNCDPVYTQHSIMHSSTPLLATFIVLIIYYRNWPKTDSYLGPTEGNPREEQWLFCPLPWVSL